MKSKHKVDTIPDNSVIFVRSAGELNPLFTTAAMMMLAKITEASTSIVW
jgi:hypothetical protein